MPIRRLYLRVKSIHRRLGAVARGALRRVPAARDRQPAPLARITEQERLLDVLHGMPEPYRSAIVHCHIDGLAPDIVARRLGVPADVVAARLSRAEEMLRARMAAARGP